MHLQFAGQCRRVEVPTARLVEPDHDAGDVAQHARYTGPDGRAHDSGVNASASNDEAVSATSRPRDDAPRQIAAVTFTVGSGSWAPTTRNC